MSNYIVTQLTLNKFQYKEVLKPLASEHAAFDLNLAVPAPKSLPRFSREVLLAFAHHVVALNLDSSEMHTIVENLDNYLDDVEDLDDLAHEYAEILHNADQGAIVQLLQVGSVAYSNYSMHGAISAPDWKRMIWGTDQIEAVEVEGRTIKIFTRSNITGFIAAWSERALLDLSVLIIDSGCHHCVVSEYESGKCVSIRRDRKGDLKALAQSLLGYTKGELV